MTLQEREINGLPDSFHLGDYMFGIEVVDKLKRSSLFKVVKVLLLKIGLTLEADIPIPLIKIPVPCAFQNPLQ
jgi:hypothetical protein